MDFFLFLLLLCTCDVLVKNKVLTEFLLRRQSIQSHQISHREQLRDLARHFFIYWEKEEKKKKKKKDNHHHLLLLLLFCHGEASEEAVQCV